MEVILIIVVTFLYVCTQSILEGLKRMANVLEKMEDK